MTRFYLLVATAKDEDLEKTVLEAYEWYERQHADGRKDLDVVGKKIAHVAAKVPGMAEYCYGQYQEVKAIISCLERRADEARGVRRKHYTEHYARSLSPTQIDKYLEGDPEILRFRALVEMMSLSKGKLEALSKGIEMLHWKIGHLVDLLKNELDEAVFSEQGSSL
jgi:hypothetical protein